MICIITSLAMDSNIGVLLYSEVAGTHEEVVAILCQHDQPAILSHHDIILSRCFLPAIDCKVNSEQLITAPRVINNREKIMWTPEGAVNFDNLVAPQLRLLRETWLDPISQASMSILLKMTNFSKAASNSSRTVDLSSRPVRRASPTPRKILRAKQKMNKTHNIFKLAKNASKPSVLSSHQACFTEILYDLRD